jgi:hypothetical protein
VSKSEILILAIADKNTFQQEAPGVPSLKNEFLVQQPLPLIE